MQAQEPGYGIGLCPRAYGSRTEKACEEEQAPREEGQGFGKTYRQEAHNYPETASAVVPIAHYSARQENFLVQNPHRKPPAFDESGGDITEVEDNRDDLDREEVHSSRRCLGQEVRCYGKSLPESDMISPMR